LCPIHRRDAEHVYDATAPGPRAYCARAGVVVLGEGIYGPIHGSPFSYHVPYDRDVGAEDAAEGLEDRVCAEGNVVPGEV
jgi:hypothetical protein